jgi:plastocyanin
MRRLIAAVCVIAGSMFVGAAPADAGGGGCHGGATEGAGLEVRIVQACFTPTLLRVQEGATVTFTNGDEMLHALSGTELGYDDLSSGQSVERRFDRAGTYPYMCHLHPGMTGAVIVGEDSPALASATRPAPADDDRGVHPALAATIAAAVGLGAGVLLQRKRGAARA